MSTSPFPFDLNSLSTLQLLQLQQEISTILVTRHTSEEEQVVAAAVHHAQLETIPLNVLEKHHVTKLGELLSKTIPKADVMPLTYTLNWLQHKTFLQHQRTNKRAQSGIARRLRYKCTCCGVSFVWTSQDGELYTLENLPPHFTVCIPSTKLFAGTAQPAGAAAVILKNLPSVANAARRHYHDGGKLKPVLRELQESHTDVEGAPEATLYSIFDNIRKALQQAEAQQQQGGGDAGDEQQAVGQDEMATETLA